MHRAFPLLRTEEQAFLQMLLVEVEVKCQGVTRLEAV
jgi:hypothetical protein